MGLDDEFKLRKATVKEKLDFRSYMISVNGQVYTDGFADSSGFVKDRRDNTRSVAILAEVFN